MISAAAAFLRSTGRGWFADQMHYTDSHGADITLTRTWVNGAVSGSISGTAQNGLTGSVYFTGTFDPYTWAVTSNPGWVGVSFSAPNGIPAPQHPAFVSWRGKLFHCSYTDVLGTITFYGSVGDDYSHVAIAAGGSVTLAMFGDQTSLYHAVFHPNGQFTSTEMDLATMPIALTASGEPLGTPPGVLVLFNPYAWSSEGNNHCSIATGNLVIEPTFLFVRPDGKTGAKFLGLKDGGGFLVGFYPTLPVPDLYYQSPLYIYKAGIGDLVFDATTDLPQRTFPPRSP